MSTAAQTFFLVVERAERRREHCCNPGAACPHANDIFFAFAFFCFFKQRQYSRRTSLGCSICAQTESARGSLHPRVLSAIICSIFDRNLTPWAPLDNTQKGTALWTQPCSVLLTDGLSMSLLVAQNKCLQCLQLQIKMVSSSCFIINCFDWIYYKTMINRKKSLFVGLNVFWLFFLIK